MENVATSFYMWNIDQNLWSCYSDWQFLRAWQIVYSPSVSYLHRRQNTRLHIGVSFEDESLNVEMCDSLETDEIILLCDVYGLIEDDLHDRIEDLVEILKI